jgi:cell division protein FtsI/penicillin-binding protein 2
MLRREAVAMLLGASLGDAHGAALLFDLRTGRLIVAEGGPLARRWPGPPGSTVKPFSLGALLAAGKLTAGEEFPCPGHLAIAGRSFNCSHPPIGAPVRVATAIAYSCNCFVAHFAQRFQAGELARSLARCGFSRLQPAPAGDPTRLQALGENRIEVTAFELLMAYRHLAAHAAAPILEGLEGAVEYGTARLARTPGITVAGKTGSVRTAAGVPVAWFAGFAPSRAPEVVVAVMLQGRSGGADAAPVAGRMLAAHRAGRL